MRKKIIIGCGALLVIAAGVLAALMRGMPQAVQLPLSGVDVSAAPDGEYVGSHDSGRWSTEVLVTVRDRRIESVVVLRDVTAAELTDCADEMIRRVLAEQTTRVDAVAGATATSKAYCKAIENALSAATTG